MDATGPRSERPFSRGGLARGPFFASELFVYGPALVAAYQLESKTAIYPRIILSDGVTAHARTELTQFGGGETEVHRKLLAVDDDGWVFVNYLDSIWDEPEEVDEMLAEHRGHIADNLESQRGKPHIHLKYQWLAGYHDRFCRSRLGAEQAAEHLIGALDGPRLELFGADVPLPIPRDGFPGLEF